MPLEGGLKAPAGLGALEIARVVVVGGGAAVGVKKGWRRVEVVEEVTVRWADGRRLAWLGKDGGPSCFVEDSEGPSSCAVDGNGLLGDRTGSVFSSTGGEGVLLRCLLGDSGGTSSLLLVLLALLTCLDGDAGMLRLLVGLAKGLVGRSAPEPLLLIWKGRRTNGLLLTGESESGFVEESDDAAFVGDCVGVDARAVAGDWLFCRRKGDWRPESKESGDGRSWLAYKY